MRVLKALLAVLALLVAGLLSAYGLTRPEGPDKLSTSAARLRPGPHAVASVERTLVDASRATPAHDEFSGASSRTLNVTLWFPENLEGAHPLVVYSHGFMSMRSEAVDYASHLASYGIVVISADYPATNFRGPGGPNIADATSQPGDVAFLIDTVTGWSEAERPFRGTIDPQRIGAAGLSLGGFTSTVAAFHPTLRDPRLSAAVSIAGPSAMFSARFFENAALPFLMIAGEADAIVGYALNAAPLPGKLAHGGALLTLAGGSHAGFAPTSAGVMRVFGNPDRIGCAALTRVLKSAPRENPFVALGGEEQGVLVRSELAPPCANGAPKQALAAGRQIMITTLALRAFFESVWESDPTLRAESASFLAEGIARDFEEVRFDAVPPLPPGREAKLSELPEPPATPAADAVTLAAPEPAAPLVAAPLPELAPALGAPQP